MKKHIYLIGFMGTGKSTVSKKLRSLLGMREIDMDVAIVRDSHMSINEMFEQYGEMYFRDHETRMLEKIAGYRPAIISCGGGTVLRSQNIEIMKKSGVIVLLTATPQTVFERVRNGRNRPLLNGHMNVEYIGQLMEKRQETYESACDFRVDTDGRTPDEIAEEIITYYKTLDRINEKKK